MNTMRTLLVWITLAGALALGACGEPRESMVLARFDLASSPATAPDHAGWTTPRGIHQFLDGWRNPEPNGIWTTSDAAEVLLEVEGRDSVLELVLQTHPILAGRGITYTLLCNETKLATRQLREGWKPDSLRVRVPDALVRDGRVRLRLVSSDHLGPADGFDEARALFVQSIQWSARLDRGERARWERLTTPTRGTNPLVATSLPSRRHAEDLPDVLVILLDAARADHFSSYGYDRATTPHADALAARGVRFERVFATAPYTRSSVATILSGLSWRDHGVLSHEDALAESHYTFVEALRDAGYQTLGISDNANVGRNAGSTQGFDEFFEAWTMFADEAERRPEQWWPERPLRIFEQRLRRGFDPSLPVFTYLHLLPPHDPYFPSAEHDVFGDRDYRGDLRGDGSDIAAFDQKHRPAEGPDFERLIALYDGGLRRGDALAQRALDGWTALGRTRPTLVVLLSDHGEAFGEHGRFGHNTTPYDEMTHVPLILAPRELVPDAVAAASRSLHSLEDFYPLLLRTLGIGMSETSPMPRSFFQSYAHPERGRREIFIRCGFPRFARRTSTSLSVFWEWEQQSTFDLVRDPGARVDLRGKSTDGWRVDWPRLNGFLQGGSASPAATSTLSPDDIERLKALGYL